jgi:hypothetical protein
MQHEPGAVKGGKGRGWFWMALCCVPMIALVILIVMGIWRSR